MFQYEIGHVIQHRRYNYRGVVIAVDDRCLAPDDWYAKNRTQPRRNQPWYHVLCDGGRETYVAEENLEADDSGMEIDHPLLGRLFATFAHGRYHRPGLN
jgi:heat shock protein HspQ